jgi:CHAT domain-containing protein
LGKRSKLFFPVYLTFLAVAVAAPALAVNVQRLLDRVDRTFDGRTLDPGLEKELRAALRQVQAKRDKRLTAAVRIRLGRVDLFYGQPQIQLGLKTARELGDHAMEAVALSALGERQLLGRFPRQAIDLLVQAVGSFQTLGDHQGEAAARSLLAEAQEQLGLYEEALANLQAAREIRPARLPLPLLRDVIESLRLGRLSYLLGRYGKAARPLEESLPGLLKLRQQGDPQVYERFLKAVGPLVESFKSGRTGAELLAELQPPPATAPARPDPEQKRPRPRRDAAPPPEADGAAKMMAAILALAKAKTEHDLATIQNVMGGQTNTDAAAALMCEAEIRNFLGRVYALDGDAKKAAEQYLQAWDIFEATRLKLLQLWFPNGLETSPSGSGYDLVREHGAAREKGLPSPPEISGPCQASEQAQYDLWWGDFRAATGQDPGALTAYETAIRKGVDSRALALGGKAAILARQGKMEEALGTYQQAIDAAESILRQIRLDQLVSSFVGRQAPLYSRAVELAAELKQTDVAFEIAERARARAFLNQIGNLRLDPRGTPPDLTTTWRAARQRLEDATAQRRMDRDEALRQQDARAEDAARKAYEDVLARLQQANPQYASLVSVQVAGREEVQKLLAPDRALVEYFVLDQKTLAWVIDRESSRLVELPVASPDLRGQIEAFRLQVAHRIADERGARELYAALIAPLEPLLGRRSLIIVPHGPLHYLPFAALRSAAGRYLIEDHALALAPSASALRFLYKAPFHPDPGATSALVLGDSDGSLPEAGREAEAVANLYGAKVHRGKDATEALVKQEIGRADVLHLAAHGWYDPVHPLFSGVALAAGGGQDGRLEVHEIYGLDLSASCVVVLSACETALGERSEGDDVIGLSRAFLVAGASAVVTSLWRIDDSAAAELMVAFHRHLRAGEPAAAALRAAQLEILARPEWKAPFFWSAFTVTGDGG